MLGGLSGGGMGFIFARGGRREAQERLQEIMAAAKRELEQASLCDGPRGLRFRD